MIQFKPNARHKAFEIIEKLEAVKVWFSKSRFCGLDGGWSQKRPKKALEAILTTQHLYAEANVRLIKSVPTGDE